MKQNNQLDGFIPTFYEALNLTCGPPQFFLMSHFKQIQHVNLALNNNGHLNAVAKSKISM